MISQKIDENKPNGFGLVASPQPTSGFSKKNIKDSIRRVFPITISRDTTNVNKRMRKA